MKRWTDDIGAWASSLRFSGFTVLIIGLVGAGAIIISPSLTTFVQQRREIAELQASVEQRQQAVDEIDSVREKWKDPAYVRAQARDRLFYVMPGETQLNVIDDVPIPVESSEETRAGLSRIEGNWAETLVSSFVVAGTADMPPEVAPEAPTETPAPEETAPTEEPTP